MRKREIDHVVHPRGEMVARARDWLRVPGKDNLFMACDDSTIIKKLNSPAFGTSFPLYAAQDEDWQLQLPG